MDTHKIKIYKDTKKYIDIVINILQEHNVNDKIKNTILNIFPHNTNLTYKNINLLYQKSTDAICKNHILTLQNDINNNLNMISICKTKYIEIYDTNEIYNLINNINIKDFNKRMVSNYNNNFYYIVFDILNHIYMSYGYYDNILETIKLGPIEYDDILFPILRNNDYNLSEVIIDEIINMRLSDKNQNKLVNKLNEIINIYSVSHTIYIDKQNVYNIISDNDYIINDKILQDLIKDIDNKYIGNKKKYGIFRFGQYYFLTYGYEIS